MGFIFGGGNFREEDRITKNAKIAPMRKFSHLQYYAVAVLFWLIQVKKFTLIDVKYFCL